MGTRVELQTLLEEILGSRNVYYQPPESVKLSYPCILYLKSTIDTTYANNRSYMHKTRYMVTHIDKHPDSKVLDKLISLPMCSFDRHFTADNLNHDSFYIYF